MTSFSAPIWLEMFDEDHIAQWDVDDPRALERLLDCLDETDDKTRQMAARIIGDLAAQYNVRSDRVILPLVYALRADNSADVRMMAAYALAQYDEPTAKDALGAALMTDGSPLVRARAAQEIGRFTGDRVVNALLRAADDPHHLVRRAIVISLAQSADPRAAIGLMNALDDTDIDIAQLAAIALLRRQHDQRALDTLVKHWSATSECVQLEALPLLLSVATIELTLFLLSHTKEEAIQTKARLLTYLGHIGDKTTIPQILSYLDDERELVRSAALRALRVIIARDGSTSEIIAPLVAIAEADPHEAARRSAVLALGETGDGRAYQALVHLLPQTKGALRREIVGVLSRAARERYSTTMLSGDSPIG